MSYKINAPKITEAVRDAIVSPSEASIIYNTDKDRLEYYDTYWGWHPVALTPSAMRDWGVEFIEDFHLSSVSAFWGSVALNAGLVSAISGPFGITTMSTGVNTNGGHLYRGTTNAIAFGSGLLRFETYIKVPTDSSVAETFQSLYGFLNTVTAVNQTNAIYFLYDEQGISTGSASSGNWQIVTVAGGLRTFTTTAVAINNANFQKLRIDVNALGTSVAFYIDNILVGTHVATIPTGSSNITTSGAYIQKSAGTTARTMLMDYLYLKAKFTTPR